MYWCSESVSKITVPSSVAFTVPTGIAIAAATATGAAAARQPSPAAATIASSSAKARKVRWVPTSGIRTSAASIVPSSEPTVEIAYRRPATRPECSTSGTASRIAHGEQVPASPTGIAIRASTANSEPTKAPASISSRALTEISKNGCATSGTSASSTAAPITARQRL